MKQYHQTPLEVQLFLNLECVQTVYGWMSGRNVPAIDNLINLALLWGITIEEIICC